MRLKNVKKILEGPAIRMRLMRPVELNDLIIEYQDNEEKRYGTKSNIDHLVIHMMMIGQKAFVKESQKMKKEFEAYSNN